MPLATLEEDCTVEELDTTTDELDTALDELTELETVIDEETWVTEDDDDNILDEPTELDTAVDELDATADEVITITEELDATRLDDSATVLDELADTVLEDYKTPEDELAPLTDELDNALDDPVTTAVVLVSEQPARAKAIAASGRAILVRVISIAPSWA